MRRFALLLVLSIAASCGSSIPRAVTTLDLGGYKVTVEIAADARYDGRQTTSQYLNVVDADGSERRAVLMNFGALEGAAIVVRDGRLTVGNHDYGELPSGSRVALDASGAVTVDGVERAGTPRAQPAGPTSGG